MASRTFAAHQKLLNSPRFLSESKPLSGGIKALCPRRLSKSSLQKQCTTRAVQKSVEEFEKSVEDSEEVDLYRDTPLRYLGYANECGEAFAAFLPVGGVPFSYAVAIAYVLADTIDKTGKAWSSTEEDPECKVDTQLPVDSSQLFTTYSSFHLQECKGPVPHPLRLVHTGSSMMDTLVWQLLASVFIPGSIIHAGVAATEMGVHAALATSPAVFQVSKTLLDVGVDLEKALPTAVGLAVIPFIVHPIDDTIHKVLDLSIRPTMLWGVCTQAGGKQSNLDECELPLEEHAEEAPGAQISGAYPEEVSVPDLMRGTGALAAACAFPPTMFYLSDAFLR